MSAPPRRWAAQALWVSLVVALLVLARSLNASSLLASALDWIRGLGPWGVVVFVLVYVLAAVLLLPAVILTLGAGAVFGVARGSVLVSIASTLGATAAFLVGRYFARGWVARQIEGNATFRAIDDAVAREGWRIVGLTRLSPAFPFNLLNYAYGLTRVSVRHYVVASWIGMMPGTVLYVSLGAFAGDVAAAGAVRHSRTPTEWALYVVGLLATVAVTFSITRIARRALQQQSGC